MSRFPAILLRLLSIVVILAAYFITDKPDRLSVMHFNLNEHSYISSASSLGFKKEVKQIKPGESRSHRKIQVQKQMVSKAFLTKDISWQMHYLVLDVREFAGFFRESYYFLFFKEINPPPPKESASLV